MAVLPRIPTGNACPYVDGENLLASIRPHDLVYFVLNVGNADTQLLVLPADDNGIRHLIVVDVGTVSRSKLPALIDDLSAPGGASVPLLSPNSRVKLLVATHPHGDHVGGIPDFLNKKGALLNTGELWDPAYYHSTGAWHLMMRWLEANPDVPRLHPTSGTRRHIGEVAVTALSPSIRLRNHFDTYGVHINNSSIALLVEFPIRRVFTGDHDTFAAGRQDRAADRQRLLLGADAQSMSWSAVDVDFPTLAMDHDPRHYLLGLARGTEPLSAHVFKVPHHCSKHGLNLELVERIRPKYSLISAASTDGGHAFPHDVALSQLREALDPIATKAHGHKDLWDPDVNIITTADEFDDGTPLGTIALVMTPTGRNRKLFRLGDRANSRIDPHRLTSCWRKR